MLLGMIVGVGSAFLLISLSPGLFWVRNGVWKTSLVAGSTRADPYTRAIVARNYLFILNRSEAVYFLADTDGEKPLNRRCRYRVQGGNLPARWWSITAYGEDHFLIPNPYGIYSLTSANVVKEGDSWELYLSHEPRGKNWIPLAGEGRFYLTLRLYNPERIVEEEPAKISLPTIQREGCP